MPLARFIRAVGKPATRGLEERADHLGMMIGPMLFGGIADQWSLESVFLMGRIVSIGLVLACWLLLRRRPMVQDNVGLTKPMPADTAVADSHIQKRAVDEPPLICERYRPRKT